MNCNALNIISIFCDIVLYDNIQYQNYDQITIHGLWFVPIDPIWNLQWIYTKVVVLIYSCHISYITAITKSISVKEKNCKLHTICVELSIKIKIEFAIKIQVHFKATWLKLIIFWCKYPLKIVLINKKGNRQVLLKM